MLIILIDFAIVELIDKMSLLKENIYETTYLCRL